MNQAICPRWLEVFESVVNSRVTFDIIVIIEFRFVHVMNIKWSICLCLLVQIMLDLSTDVNLT